VKQEQYLFRRHHSRALARNRPHVQVKINAHLLIHCAHSFGGGVGRGLVFIEHENRRPRARNAATECPGRQRPLPRIAQAG
jgi:hypothetical protein